MENIFKSLCSSCKFVQWKSGEGYFCLKEQKPIKKIITKKCKWWPPVNLHEDDEEEYV